MFTYLEIRVIFQLIILLGSVPRSKSVGEQDIEQVMIQLAANT